MADLSDTITDLAGAPAAIATDGTSTTERPLTEIIQADQYTAAKAAITGTNAQGGPKSLWSKLRSAVALPRDPL